jgi:nucleoside-diphosphate kinase
MLKPDVINRNIIGKVLSMIEGHEFKIIKMEKKQLSIENANEFYKDHKEKSFFKDMVARINNGEVVGLLLAYKNEDAVTVLRTLMGATNPANADEGTIRKAYGISIDENTLHGSDSFENVTREAHIFFGK